MYLRHNQFTELSCICRPQWSNQSPRGTGTRETKRAGGETSVEREGKESCIWRDEERGGGEEEERRKDKKTATDGAGKCSAEVDWRETGDCMGMMVTTLRLSCVIHKPTRPSGISLK